MESRYPQYAYYEWSFYKEAWLGTVNDYNSFWVSILRGKYASCNEGEGPLFFIGLQVIDPEDLSRVVGDCVYSKGQWKVDLSTCSLFI